MLNYTTIENLFGTPLNHVPRPHKPFQLKPWHVAVGLVAGILIYKGCQKVKEVFFKDKKNKLLIPLKLKEDKKD
jgi:hypothetical protein